MNLKVITGFFAVGVLAIVISLVGTVVTAVRDHQAKSQAIPAPIITPAS